MRKLKEKQGFTLIELVVVMAIIAILAVLIIGAITIARHTATETANRSNARTVQTALEAYYASNKNYPDILGTAISDNTTDTTLNIAATNLSTSACTGNGGGTQDNSGGGNIVSSSTNHNYTITIAPWNCNTNGQGGYNIGTISGP